MSQLNTTEQARLNALKAQVNKSSAESAELAALVAKQAA